MKNVYSSDSLPEVGHYRNLLEQAGIACFIRNEQLAGALGEIPFLECRPQLCVLDDDDEQRALRLIKAQLEPVNAPSWRCARCGENNEGQFAVCWNCGVADPQE